ncbi:hypothetical protein AB0D67_34115 [Streptosporangium sp. NPDC048047]
MTEEEKEVPVGQALNGLDVYPLPEGWTALGAMVTSSEVVYELPFA